MITPILKDPDETLSFQKSVVGANSYLRMSDNVSGSSKIYQVFS